MLRSTAAPAGKAVVREPVRSPSEVSMSRGAPASGAFFALLALLSWVLVACSNEDAVLGVVGDSQGSTVSLARDIQPIFSASCAVAFCHGSPLAAPMSLLSSDTHLSLV